MDEEFLNFLCKENWFHDMDEEYLKFKKDNTGEILSVARNLLFIWSTFEWTCAPIKPLKLNASSEDGQTPRLIGEYRFEIRITGELPDNPRDVGLAMNDGRHVHLRDEAFQTKFFNVKIEDGGFGQPNITETIYDRKPYWTKRLVFDKSPFGERSDWNDQFYEYNFWGNPSRLVSWPHKDFVAYSPTLDALAADNGIMGIFSGIRNWLFKR